MSEMVNRVTEAITEKLYGGPLKGVCPHCGQGQRDNPVALPDVARAAIAAMREPTDAMCEAADWWQQSEVNQYQAAIDEALK